MMKTIRMSKAETRRYEDRGADGDEFRWHTITRAKNLANETGKPVEIHSFDGIVFEQVLPEEP